VGNISNSAKTIQAQILSANTVLPSQTEQELENTKALARQDGNHNLVLLNSENTTAPQVYNLKVTEMDLDQVQLGQTIKTGQIQGTLQFMDNGSDDPIYNALKSEQNLYSLSEKEAGQFVLALTVWGFGGSDDEDKFKLDYSPRELKAFVSEFQKEIGAEATGVWNEESFVKAKAFVLEHFDKDEMMTDAQFKNFIGDVQNYFQGKITRDQANENLEAYLYDQRSQPLHAPSKPDEIGFQSFQSQFKPEEQMLIGLCLSNYSRNEIPVLQAILKGNTPAETAKTQLLDAFYDPEEIPEVLAPGADLSKELGKVLVKELQADTLDMPAEKVSGKFDQNTYDALQASLKEDYELDLSPEGLRQFTQAALKAILAKARGEIDEDQLDSQLEALSKKRF